MWSVKNTKSYKSGEAIWCRAMGIEKTFRIIYVLYIIMNIRLVNNCFTSGSQIDYMIMDLIVAIEAFTY